MANSFPDTKAFSQISHDLHIIYYNQDSQLLFICSSDRSFALYEELVKVFAPSGHQILTLVEINRVIRRLRNPEFFNIGMKSSVRGGKTESYRIIAGQSAHDSVSKADGYLFHRGHVFGKGSSDNGDITIGFSSASKVWANAYCRIPELIDWCKALAKEIIDTAPVNTNSNLDHLQVGEIVSSLPGISVFADYGPDIFRRDIRLTHIPSGIELPLYECDLRIESQTENIIRFSVVIGTISGAYDFEVSGSTFFSCQDHSADDFQITRKQSTSSLLDFLNSDPINFYFQDFSRLRGKELFRAPTIENSFDSSCLRPIVWEGVSIVSETDSSAEGTGEISVHERCRRHFADLGAQIVFFDDRAGEIADFVTFQETEKEVLVSLYHCKASETKTPGHRVKDLYEVCGQCAKSLLRINSPATLIQRIEARASGASTFEKGSIEEFRRLVERTKAKKYKFSINVVQPGLHGKDIPESLQLLLLSTQEFLKRIRDVQFTVLCS